MLTTTHICPEALRSIHTRNQHSNHLDQALQPQNTDPQACTRDPRRHAYAALHANQSPRPFIQPRGYYSASPSVYSFARRVLTAASHVYTLVLWFPVLGQNERTSDSSTREDSGLVRGVAGASLWGCCWMETRETEREVGALRCGF